MDPVLDLVGQTLVFDSEAEEAAVEVGGKAEMVGLDPSGRRDREVGNWMSD